MSEFDGYMDEEFDGYMDEEFDDYMDELDQGDRFVERAEQWWRQIYGQRLKKNIHEETMDEMNAGLGIRAWLLGGNANDLKAFLDHALDLLQKEMEVTFPDTKTESSADSLSMLLHMLYKMSLARAVIESGSSAIEPLDCKGTAESLRAILDGSAEDIDAFVARLWSRTRNAFPCKDELPEDVHTPIELPEVRIPQLPSEKPA